MGVDNVDVRAATRAGVMVMNTPDGNTVSACHSEKEKSMQTALSSAFLSSGVHGAAHRVVAE